MTEPAQEKESILKLARVGYDNVIGYVEGGFDNLKDNCNKNDKSYSIVSLGSADLSNVKTFIEENCSEKQFQKFIDVRETSEWESTGVVPNSILVSMKNLETKLPEILTLSNDTTLAVFCKTGGRATVLVLF